MRRFLHYLTRGDDLDVDLRRAGVVLDRGHHPRPFDPHVVWVGTGQNVGGRHVGYGDGVYRSGDGGKSWENVGLQRSEHISKIIVHPKEPNTVWVASQGPLWSSGGQRGLYKTTDGGKSWTQVPIELNLRKGAVFRSTDRGASWEKRSDTVSGGTGPHYYPEL